MPVAGRDGSAAACHLRIQILDLAGRQEDHVLGDVRDAIADALQVVSGE